MLLKKIPPLGSTSRKEDFNRVQHDIQEKLGKITWTDVLPSDNGSSLVCKSSYIKETLTSEELREIKNILPQGFSIALEQEPTLEKSNY